MKHKIQAATQSLFTVFKLVLKFPQCLFVSFVLLLLCYYYCDTALWTCNQAYGNVNRLVNTLDSNMLTLTIFLSLWGHFHHIKTKAYGT